MVKNKIKLFIMILFFIFPLYADESMLDILTVEVYGNTTITVCSGYNSAYMIVQNNDGLINQYLVVKEDNFEIPEVYGEFLLTYYTIKNRRQTWKTDDNGVSYIARIDDNTRELDRFLLLLTNIDRINSYDFQTFQIDNCNTGKDELLEFYDAVTYSDTTESIGSYAGYLMSIGASDYISYIHNLGKEIR